MIETRGNTALVWCSRGAGLGATIGALLAFGCQGEVTRGGMMPGGAAVGASGVTTTAGDGSTTDATTTVAADGTTTTVAADGTMTTVAADGTTTTVAADGTVTTTTDTAVDTTTDTTTTATTETPTDTLGAAVAEQCAAAAGELRVGTTRLKRLTRPQFNNTVRDLIGATGNPTSDLVADEKVGPFQSNSIAPITDLLVQQHSEIAEALAADAQTRMASISPCDLAADTTTTCATQFIEDFGLRTYRRPLLTSERDSYLALYNSAAASGTAADGFKEVVYTMLQSPNFLYHVDVGNTGAPSSTPVPATSYELASRLSYFLWNTMPDEELFALAATDGLQDVATIQTQVERMLADPRATDSIPEFHLQWLGIGDMEGLTKDPAMFPGFDAPLAAAIRDETGTFADYIVRQGDGLLNTLLTGNFAFLQGPLFDLYGVAQPVDFVPGNSVTLDATQRSGILTRAAFLTTHAHANQTSPVHRGILVRENVLCQPIGSPPADVNNTPPTPTAATTTRERFDAHRTNPSCAACHRLTDPIGLGFENYDPIGAYRTQDGSFPVDASGEIVEAGADTDGVFNGAIELSQVLASSERVQQCVANQWFRFALRRLESNDDACTLQQLHTSFAETGNIRNIITQITVSDAFRYVRATGGTQTL